MSYEVDFYESWSDFLSNYDFSDWEKETGYQIVSEATLLSVLRGAAKRIKAKGFLLQKGIKYEIWRNAKNQYIHLIDNIDYIESIIKDVDANQSILVIEPKKRKRGAK